MTFSFWGKSMKRRRLWRGLTLLAALVATAGVLLYGVLTSDEATAVLTIKVVDEEGTPVEGAQVKAWALGSDRGHALWNEEKHGPPPVAQTDAAGKARIRYPFFHGERVPVYTVSVTVKHPQFCRRSEHISLGAPWGPLPKIVLQRGVRLKIRPKNRDGKAIASRCFLLFGSQDYQDPLSHQQSDGWIVTEAIPAEHRTLYVVHVPKTGAPLFGGPYRWDPKDSSTHQAEITLQPGPKVVGRLDDNVPRPVQNGFVVYSATMPKSDEPAWESWQGRVSISADGSFEIPSLPPGGDVQLLAMCDGFVSEKPTIAEITQIQKAYPGGSNPRHYDAIPTLVTLTESVNNVVLKMRPTYRLKVTVVDPDGKPVEAATACICPNQLFYGIGSTILGSCYSTTKVLFSRQYVRIGSDHYRADTDANGVAVFNDVPRCVQRISIFDPRWELPISKFDNSRSETVDVNGDTQRTVTVQSKGTQTQTGRLPIMRWWSAQLRRIPKWP